MLSFIVDLEEKTLVSRYLRSKCGVSARTLAKLKRIEGGIKVNGKNAKAIDYVNNGDEISIYFDESPSCGVVPVYMPLSVLYEDENFLIVDKPYDMPVHPTKQHQSDTLANAVAYYAHDKNENYKFRAVNRIDRNTTGIVIIAKNRHVGYALASSGIFKEYIAVCSGSLEGSGTVDLPIKLSATSKIVREVNFDGKPAVTHYKVLKTNENYSVLKLILETGRTHQIRCHMAHIGHPLLGDDLYGGSLELINRHALHCCRVTFTHPINNKNIEVVSPIPYDMKKFI